jgi:predicted nucleotidyltransferase/uncharacterized protein with HEPN domain
MAELHQHRNAIERIVAAHGAANVRVCGSVARGDARPDSDIDLVVDMDDDRGALDLSELILDLQDELDRPVEVLRVPPEHVRSARSPIRQILATAIPLGDTVPRPSLREDHDRRLLAELADSLTLVAGYAPGNQVEFMRSDMAVDATRHRLAEIAAVCARLSKDLKARHPEVRWRALTGLAAVLSHGPYAAWEISHRHLAPLEAVIQSETR